MASFWKKLQEKYVISIRNQNSFFESIKSTLSLTEILSIGFAIFAIPIIASFLLLKFTSLGTLLNPIKEEKAKVVALNRYTDSLEHQVSAQQTYFDNLQRILNGEEIQELEATEIDSQEIANINISDPGNRELALREVVNTRELTESGQSEESSIWFFDEPIEGVISSEFTPNENHFGIDIVAPKNTVIKAIADGQVLYSAWNLEDGHTLVLFHDDGFISIYKHAEKILKETNESIESGEAIAIIGNSGENSTGYHLHFELWRNGKPINPTEYINFEI